MDKYVIAPPSGSTNNSVGAADRPWKEGHFEKLVADDVIAKGPVVDVRAFGAIGDGVHDDTAAIQAAIDYAAISAKTVFFPAARFLVTAPIDVKTSIRGVCATRYSDNGSVIVCDFDTSSDDEKGVLDITSAPTLYIGGIDIDLNEHNKTYGIHYHPTNKIHIYLENISVVNLGKDSIGIVLSVTNSSSRAVYGNNILVRGKNYQANCGIYVGENTGDCMLTDVEVMFVQRGIVNKAGLLRLSNIHVYCGNESVMSDSDILDAYQAGTICVETYGIIFGSDICLDAGYQCWVQRSAESIISNMVIWCDDWMDYASNHSGTMIGNGGTDYVADAVVNIGLLLVGGKQTAYSKIIGDSTNVRIQKMYTHYDGLNTAKPLFNPLINRYTDKQTYNLITSSANYSCIAILYFGGFNGTATFMIADNAFAEEVTLSYDGTWHAKMVNKGQGQISLWYKVSGSFVYVYCNRPSNRIFVSNVLNSYEMVLIDLGEMKGFTAPTQADTTGLTQITSA